MSSKRYAILLSVLLAITLFLPGRASSVGAADAGPEHSVLFIENAGQWLPSKGSGQAPRFQVWGGRQMLWLAEDALWITILGRDEASLEDLAADRVPWMDDRFPLEQASPGMPNPYTAGVNIRLSFPRANPHPRLEPFDRLETHVSYVNGNDPKDWRVDVPVWGGVRYVDIYPGVDLIMGAGTALGLDDGRLQPPSQLGGRWSALRWRVEAREGANLAAVRLRVEGANAVTVDKNILHLSTAAGNLALPLPAADRTNKESVKVTRLDAQAFDVTAPLALARTKVTASTTAWHAATSPQSGGLPYATFLGSSLTDIGRGIAVDSAGQAYITGHTWSAEFPASLGPGYDTSFNSGEDAFVVKLDAAGARLLYATFLGGSNWDEGYGIAVDGAGQAYVTGYTESADFPASLGPGYDTSYNGGYHGDAFVIKLDAAGTALRYATFLGGSGDDWGSGIAVDGAGQAYITGTTYSADFPASLGPGYDTSFNGTDSDAFVVKLDAAGARLRYATFLGGTYIDQGWGIAVDGAGQAYIAGRTYSADFPASLGPGYDTSYNGSYCDAFVVKLDAAGAGLDYATFLGGSGEAAADVAWGIAVDGAGQAYVTGKTYSADFPASLGPGYDTSYNDGGDCDNHAPLWRRLCRQARRGRRRPGLCHLPRRQRRRW